MIKGIFYIALGVIPILIFMISTIGVVESLLIVIATGVLTLLAAIIAKGIFCIAEAMEDSPE